MKLFLMPVLLALFVLAACQSAKAESNSTDQTVEKLQSLALDSDLGWDILASLTSEVGPRMGGSEADQRAVEWAVDKMTAMGFDRVWKEPVTFPRWVRKSETAAIVRSSKTAANSIIFPLAVTALGGSPSTGGELQAEVIHFDSLTALEQAEPSSVKGKIVFLSTRMPKRQDGSGYGETVINRSRGAFVSTQKGAVALIIRSIGTDNDRLPHTGMMSGSEEGEPVPAAAISNPDADNLMILLSHNKPVSLRMNLDVGFDGMATSYNVIGEFEGSGHNGKNVLLGAHLDSWDLGTGAIDDGAGVALVMAAASMVANLPVRPKHNTRVVLYANEEQGVYGGKEYARAHAAEIETFVLGAESDLGSDLIYQFRARVNISAEPVMVELARHLQSLGIERDTEELAGGGADVGQIRKLGVPVIDLRQDASRYFDLHHTANDTLDKVDPKHLRQNLAAWVSLLYVVANSDVAFGPIALSE